MPGSKLDLESEVLLQDKYEGLDLIGNGSHGWVYRARDLNNGSTVALKRIIVPSTEEGIPISTLREVCIHLIRIQNMFHTKYSETPHIRTPLIWIPGKFKQGLIKNVMIKN